MHLEKVIVGSLLHVCVCGCFLFVDLPLLRLFHCFPDCFCKLPSQHKHPIEHKSWRLSPEWIPKYLSALRPPASNKEQADAQQDGGDEQPCTSFMASDVDEPDDAFGVSGEAATSTSKNRSTVTRRKVLRNRAKGEV